MKPTFKQNIILLLMSLLLPKGLLGQTLLPPTSVKASQKNTNCIKITCKHPHFTAATSLQLYRSKLPNFTTAQLIISKHHETTFLDQDRNLEADVWYYYWILEENPQGQKSAPSKMATGKKIAAGVQVRLLPPTELYASNHLTSIQLKWVSQMLSDEGNLSPYGFEIYRSEFFDENTAQRIAMVRDTVFTDDAASLMPNKSYYYRIRVVNEVTGETSEFSQPARGMQNRVPTGSATIYNANSTENHKKALVIGISNYTYLSTLPTTLNDARLMADLLRDNGWYVMGREDLQTKASFEKTVKDFGALLQPQDTLLIYYSGHGLNYNNVQYLVPKQANIFSRSRITVECFDLDSLIQPLLGKSKVQVVLLDAHHSDYGIYELSDFRLSRETVQRWNSQTLTIGASMWNWDASNTRRLSPFTNELYEILRQNTCLPFEDALRKMRNVPIDLRSSNAKVSVKNCD